MLFFAPLVLIGYFNFNQMPFEKFILAWFRMNYNPQRKFIYQPPHFTNIRNDIIKEDKEKLKLEYEAERKKAKNRREIKIFLRRQGYQNDF